MFIFKICDLPGDLLDLDFIFFPFESFPFNFKLLDLPVKGIK